MISTLSVFERPHIYEALIKEEMDKLGATKSDYVLLQPETILNNMKQKRLPKDVAWAIMQ